MQHIGVQPLLAKPVRQILGAKPGAGEDQHLPALQRLQLAQQDIALVSALDQHRCLPDGIHGFAGTRRLDGHRIGQEGLGKGLHLVRHGGREKDRLAGLRKRLENPLDRRIEAQINHLVALIEDEMLDIFELDLAARLQILEPPRGGDDDIDALVQRPDLEIIALAAADRQVAHLEASGEGLDAVGNLVGKLTRRRQDQHAGAPHILGLALVQQPVQQRQKIGRRLSSAGLRQTNQILALQDRRNGFLLDRCRGGQPLRGNVVNDARRQAKLEKRIAGK